MLRLVGSCDEIKYFLISGKIFAPFRMVVSVCVKETERVSYDFLYFVTYRCWLWIQSSSPNCDAHHTFNGEAFDSISINKIKGHHDCSIFNSFTIFARSHSCYKQLKIFHIEQFPCEQGMCDVWACLQIFDHFLNLAKQQHLKKEKKKMKQHQKGFYSSVDFQLK